MKVTLLENARHIWYFGFVIGILVLICGSLFCDHYVVSFLRSRGLVTTSAIPRTKVNTDERPVYSPSRYQHNFGVVPPRVELNHEFSIVNDSDHPWIIRQIKTSCRCTATQSAKNKILPSERLVLPVSLKLGNEGGNTIQQFVTVTCENPKDDHRFELTASVKDRITVSPVRSEVFLAAGDVATKTLVIENYSDRNWTDVTVSPRTQRNGDSCLTVNKVKREDLPVAKGSEGARELWSAFLHIDSHGMLDGKYEGQIEVVAHFAKGDSDTALTTFIVDVRPDVRVVPASLVFIPTGSSDGLATKTAVLRYARKDMTPNPSKIECFHDLPFSLDIRFASLAVDATQVSIVIGSLPKLFETVRGTIKIVLPPPLNQEVVVPVTVLGLAEK